MGLIDYAINKIKKIGIDRHILELVFLKEPNGLGISPSIDEQIETLVIDELVLKDLNVIGGMEVNIPLDKCNVSYVQNTLYNRNAVVTVPFELTNGRKILEALNVLLILSQEFTYGGSNRLTQLMDQLSRSKLNMENNVRPITDLKLIAPNTILIFDNTTILQNGILNVMVEHNNNLSNISMRHADHFYKLVLLAVQAYSYNKVKIELDRGALYNGHEAGAVNTILESYADAKQEYEQLLEEKWGKIAFMSDRQSMNDLVGNLIGLV